MQVALGTMHKSTCFNAIILDSKGNLWRKLVQNSYFLHMEADQVQCAFYGHIQLEELISSVSRNVPVAERQQLEFVSRLSCP